MIQLTEKFPTMESEINDAATHFGAALSWVCILIIAVLALFPIYELNRYVLIDYMTYKTGKFWGLIMMEILCLSGSFLIGRYLLHAKKNNKYSVVVNDKGAFIFSPNGTLSEEFLYAELCPSNENHHFDINLLFNIKYNITRIILYKKDDSNRTVRHIMSFQWTYYAIKNRFELYRHFLKGVQSFRPDLKIQYSTLQHFKLIKS